MAQVLRMTFLSAAGGRVSITVDNPKDDLTEAQVQTAMNTIISKNILITSGGELTAIDSAAIIETTTTDIISS